MFYYSGLTYLHTFSSRCVIHRDVKSSNILLDHTMCAKVADFGFSKYAPQEGDSGASLEVRGTAGYLDPEYVRIEADFICSSCTMLTYNMTGNLSLCSLT